MVVRDRVYVGAGSPRLRMAFKLLLADPLMQKQYNGVEKFLKKQKLKDKEKRERKMERKGRENGKHVMLVLKSGCSCVEH